jgi:hypothetical protein
MIEVGINKASRTDVASKAGQGALCRRRGPFLYDRTLLSFHLSRGSVLPTGLGIALSLDVVLSTRGTLAGPRIHGTYHDYDPMPVSNVTGQVQNLQSIMTRAKNDRNYLLPPYPL